MYRSRPGKRRRSAGAKARTLTLWCPIGTMTRVLYSPSTEPTPVPGGGRLDVILDWVAYAVEQKPGMLTSLGLSAAVLIVLALLRLTGLAVVRRRVDDQRSRHAWRKAITYVASGLGVAVVGAIWFDALRSAATILGLVSAGLIVALQGPVTNLAGWVFVVTRRPFTIGDRIQVGQHAGDVVDSRLFQFTLLEIMNWVDADQSTGRVIHIPNGVVFSEPLINYSRGIGYIWNEIPVRITFESDWRTAKALLLDIASQRDAHLGASEQEEVRRQPRPYLILYSVLTPTVYTRVEAYGVVLTVRYLCEPRARRSTEHAIWEDILDAFARDSSIEFAYPTTRFYQRYREGARTAAQRPAINTQEELREDTP